MADGGISPAVAILMSAAYTVLFVGFAAWGLWLLKMRLFYGAPFEPGDKVEVTAGEQKGLHGEIVQVDPERYRAYVAIDAGAPQLVAWGDFRKLRR